MKGRITKSVFGRFGAAIVKVQIVLPSETHTTVNLDAAIADSARGIARIHFRDRDGGAHIWRIFFQRPAGVVDGRARAFRFKVHVCALMLHGLKYTNGFAELFASFGVLDGEVQ